MSRGATAIAELGDAELVQRIATEPDEGLEGELCRRFFQRVRLYGRRHLRDPQAVADLVQEVMAAVIQAVRTGRVEEPERIPQFILGTCRFIAWRMRRGEHRRGEAAKLAGLDLEPHAAAVHGTLDAARLEACLAQLPAREQRIIYLSFHEERSAQEIAAALELSEGNVRVIRHRALARLRSVIDGKEGES